eukprot:gene14325-18964_t
MRSVPSGPGPLNAYPSIRVAKVGCAPRQRPHTMQSLERIANLLSSFGNGQAEIPLNELLARNGIPQSSGYKLVNAL